MLTQFEVNITNHRQSLHDPSLLYIFYPFFRLSGRIWCPMRAGECFKNRMMFYCNIVLNQHMLLPAAQVGARGKDEWGAMFASSMTRSSVGISKMRVQQGQTGHPWLT